MEFWSERGHELKRNEYKCSIQNWKFGMKKYIAWCVWKGKIVFDGNKKTALEMGEDN